MSRNLIPRLRRSSEICQQRMCHKRQLYRLLFQGKASVSDRAAVGDQVENIGGMVKVCCDKG